MHAVAVADVDFVLARVDLAVEAGVDERDVVALLVVLGVDLPVRGELVARALRDANDSIGKAAHSRAKPPSQSISGGAAASRFAKTRPRHDSTRTARSESPRRGSWSSPKSRADVQRAIETVRPAVVAADEDLARAVAVPDEGAAAMPADVVVAAQRAVVVDDEQRIAGDRRCDVVAVTRRAGQRARRRATRARRSLRARARAVRRRGMRRRGGGWRARRRWASRSRQAR